MHLGPLVYPPDLITLLYSTGSHFKVCEGHMGVCVTNQDFKILVFFCISQRNQTLKFLKCEHLEGFFNYIPGSREV